MNVDTSMNRRTFIGISAMLLGTAGAQAPSKPVRFGLITDSHYADIDTRGSRHYRDVLDKLKVAADTLREEALDFVVHTGDLKDDNGEKTIDDLKKIEAILQMASDKVYHVVGNHDVDCISKADFLANVKNAGFDQAKGYYSFDCKGVHFVVLDANFNSDGTEYNKGNFDWTDPNISEAQLTWLEKDLSAGDTPVIVFVHQCLDGEGPHFVTNAAAVRKVLEQSGRVQAVFQGHDHRGNHNEINGIHYVTLKAMVEGPGVQNNVFATVTLKNDGMIEVKGYGQGVSRKLKP